MFYIMVAVFCVAKFQSHGQRLENLVVNLNNIINLWLFNVLSTVYY